MNRLLLASFLFATTLNAANVTTIAGVPGVPGWFDGPQSVALFTHPTWLDIAADNAAAYSCDNGIGGNIYVVDRGNQRIRRISDAGTVTTIAFTPQSFAPPNLALNFGGAFGGGILVEPAGSGCGCGEYARGMFVAGSGTRQVMLLSPTGLLGNRDSLVILDTGAGSFPTGLARSRRYGNDLGTIVYSQSLYVADSGNHTIRRSNFILSFEGCPQPQTPNLLAGSPGQPGSADGKGSAARFFGPRGIAVAPDGSLYVTDSGNHTIRRITPDGTVTTVAGEAGVAGSNDGPALQAHLNFPSGIDVNDKGEVFIADTFNHTIRELTTDGRLITIAGVPGVAGFKDGDPTTALFNAPVGLKVAPDGSILIADTSNNVIRRLTR